MGKPVQREKVEQAHIVQLLRSIGGRAYVIGTRRRGGDYQGTMQTPGVPDLIGFLPGRIANPPRRLLFIECKAAGGRLRSEQAEFRDLSVLSGIAHIVGDLNAVIAWLMAEGYLKPENVPHYRLPEAPA